MPTMKIKSILTTILSAMTILMATTSCETEYVHSGGANDLSFAADTLSFDTIFTGDATSTTFIALYNKSNKDILIDRIWLSGGNDSRFNVNINGQNATDVERLRIQEGDSLWIFVNVKAEETLDPTPFIIEDILNVSSGTNTTTAHLIAYGQNVIRYNNARLGGSTWSSEMPYLLSGENIVDSAMTLTIKQGTQIFLEKGATLQIYGNIISIGTKDEKVIFSGVRRDEFYEDIPGQWGSIFLNSSSTDNYMTHTEISGSQYGIKADSASSIELENIIIRDASYGAMLAYGADVRISNSLLYNCGGPLFAAYGGKSHIVHCTMSNYFSWEMRRQATLKVTSAEEYPPFQEFFMANSIVVGNLTDEIEIDSLPEDKTLLSHCYLKMNKKTYDIDTDKRFEGIKQGATPGFKDRENSDYTLTEKAEALNAAYPAHSENYPYDMMGNSRLSDICPDMGALEYIPQTDEQ